LEHLSELLARGGSLLPSAVGQTVAVVGFRLEELAVEVAFRFAVAD